VILVGNDPASIMYDKMKGKKAEELGVGFKLHHLAEITSQEDIINLINVLNNDNKVHGIIVQLPLPEKFDTDLILQTIDPKKDIDSLNGGFPPPTAGAILEVLEFYGIDLNNKKIVLVGHGKMVGQPLERLLNSKGLSPVVCDSKTRDLTAITKDADILISGVGEPGLIQAEMVSSKTIIIDAGTAESSGKTVGDVSPAAYEKSASYSPVPGGVGPVTVAELMKNLIRAAKDLTKT